LNPQSRSPDASKMLPRRCTVNFQKIGFHLDEEDPSDHDGKAAIPEGVLLVGEGCVAVGGVHLLSVVLGKRVFVTETWKPQSYSERAIQTPPEGLYIK
jgi:hypothetical protein